MKPYFRYIVITVGFLLMSLVLWLSGLTRADLQLGVVVGFLIAMASVSYVAATTAQLALLFMKASSEAEITGAGWRVIFARGPEKCAIRVEDCQNCDRGGEPIVLTFVFPTEQFVKWLEDLIK